VSGISKLKEDSQELIAEGRDFGLLLKETTVSHTRITEKLSVLIHHWMSHNEEHAHEYRKWAGRLEAEGLSQIAEPIRQAADLVIASNRHFLTAQENLEAMK
jgi:hypothetical protein